MNKDEEEIVNYGLRMLVFEIIVTAFTYIIGLLLGIFIYTIIASLAFGMFRLLVGGAHCGNRLECFIVYNIIVWSTIYISTIITIKISVIFVALIANTVLFLLYSPGDTDKKPLLKKKKRKKIKIASIAFLLLIYIVAIMVKSFDPTVSNIIILSSISAAFLLSPIGYYLCRCNKGYKKQNTCT
jgi:accessory gene regulator B